MPNFASVMKDEIARLTRREMRPEIDALKKSAASHRADAAALRRRVQELERQLKSLTKVVERSQAPGKSQSVEVDTEAARANRFNAKGLAAVRARSGLSAADFGKLLDVSGQSVYAWEQGKTIPSRENIAAIAALRGLGKKALAARFSELVGS